MRLTTKIKHLLFKYKIEMDMIDEGVFQMQLIDKQTGEKNVVESDTWSGTINEGYRSHFKLSSSIEKE